jgi:rsbT antagonist protein RsbS
MAHSSASLQQVYDVLIATFPGEPTDQAVDELQQDVLKRMEATQPRGVILDISAVTTLDSFFARVISETASMIALLGGEAIVVGMRPSVAITAAELGFDLDEVETARSTDHALDLLGITIQSEPAEATDDSRHDRAGPDTGPGRDPTGAANE